MDVTIPVPIFGHMAQEQGRRIRVLAPYGILIHEIRLSQSELGWQARVVTLPNQIWVEPGGRRALCFSSDSSEGAEEMAVAFVERDCVARGHRLVDHMIAIGENATGEPSRRHVANVPLRFLPRGTIGDGASRRVLPEVSHDLSETGLYIATGHILQRGARMAIELKLPMLPERLEGVVVWKQEDSRPGKDRGMGISLLDPPLAYRLGIQSL